MDDNRLNEDLSVVGRDPTDPGVANDLQLASFTPLDEDEVGGQFGTGALQPPPSDGVGARPLKVEDLD